MRVIAKRCNAAGRAATFSILTTFEKSGAIKCIFELGLRVDQLFEDLKLAS